MGTRSRNIFRRLGLVSLLILPLLACGISALVNLGLPKHSQVVDHLSSLEKARLAEFYHLQQVLGSDLWPGWGDTKIPTILYNEAYAFLVGYPDPPSGWLKMPQQEARGGSWEAVAGDEFGGTTYYRQSLNDPRKTPEGFTVLVGDRWVTTFQTKEFAEISFYTGLQNEFPPILRQVVPYPLLWKVMAGESDAYITLLIHEAFHSYQAIVNPQRFAQSEEVMRVEGRYSWEDPAQLDAWERELDLLVDAVKASSIQDAEAFAIQFLAQRDDRRVKSKLSPELIVFERQREWLEGLAKYTELTMGRMAANTPGYKPLPELGEDHQFKDYRNRDRFWSMQLDQVRRINKSEGEIRFYYSGFAQAVLLDRLLPGWKTSALSEGRFLEDLLQEAVSLSE